MGKQLINFVKTLSTERLLEKKAELIDRVALAITPMEKLLSRDELWVVRNELKNRKVV